ncbi:hypothetical protein WNZ15_21395 [Roseibium sp. AS2]|uniref:hypothetical protein n=1 Tax=Roseibium sp. AS2 TaxID=3135781 RepID=UPI00316E402F
MVIDFPPQDSIASNIIVRWVVTGFDAVIANAAKRGFGIDKPDKFSKSTTTKACNSAGFEFQVPDRMLPSRGDDGSGTAVPAARPAKRPQDVSVLKVTGSRQKDQIATTLVSFTQGPAARVLSTAG